MTIDELLEVLMQIKSELKEGEETVVTDVYDHKLRDVGFENYEVNRNLVNISLEFDDF